MIWQVIVSKWFTSGDSIIILKGSIKIYITIIYSPTRKIEFNPFKTYINRTTRFLIPTVKFYEVEFLTKWSANRYLAHAIGDTQAPKQLNKINDNNVIYSLVDANGYKTANGYFNEVSARIEFLDFLDYFRNHDSYVDDYPADDIITGHLHVIVWKIPSRFNNRNLIELFLAGKYSELYTLEEISYMVSKNVKKTLESKGQEITIEVPNSQYSILTKAPSYRKKFQRKVRRDFRTKIDLEEDIELDYPPIVSEEWLNFV